QIQPFSGIVEAVEFLLDNQQLVAVTLGQGLGVILQPFLQMLALGETEVAEAFNLKWIDAVGCGIDLKHSQAPLADLQWPRLRVHRRGAWGATCRAALKGSRIPAYSLQPGRKMI